MFLCNRFGDKQRTDLERPAEFPDLKLPAQGTGTDDVTAVGCRVGQFQRERSGAVQNRASGEFDFDRRVFRRDRNLKTPSVKLDPEIPRRGIRRPDPCPPCDGMLSRRNGQYGKTHAVFTPDPEGGILSVQRDGAYLLFPRNNQPDFTFSVFIGDQKAFSVHFQLQSRLSGEIIVRRFAVNAQNRRRNLAEQKHLRFAGLKIQRRPVCFGPGTGPEVFQRGRAFCPPGAFPVVRGNLLLAECAGELFRIADPAAPDMKRFFRIGHAERRQAERDFALFRRVRMGVHVDPSVCPLPQRHALQGFRRIQPPVRPDSGIGQTCLPDLIARRDIRQVARGETAGGVGRHDADSREIIVKRAVDSRQPVDVNRLVQRIPDRIHLEFPHQNCAFAPVAGQGAAETFEEAEIPLGILSVIEENNPVRVVFLNPSAHIAVEVILPAGIINPHCRPVLGIGAGLAAVNVPDVLLIVIDEFFNLVRGLFPGIPDAEKAQVIHVDAGEPGGGTAVAQTGDEPFRMIFHGRAPGERAPEPGVEPEFETGIQISCMPDFVAHLLRILVFVKETHHPSRGRKITPESVEIEPHAVDKIAARGKRLAVVGKQTRFRLRIAPVPAQRDDRPDIAQPLRADIFRAIGGGLREIDVFAVTPVDAAVRHGKAVLEALARRIRGNDCRGCQFPAVRAETDQILLLACGVQIGEAPVETHPGVKKRLARFSVFKRDARRIADGVFDPQIACGNPHHACCRRVAGKFVKTRIAEFLFQHRSRGEAEEFPLFHGAVHNGDFFKESVSVEFPAPFDAHAGQFRIFTCHRDAGVFRVFADGDHPVGVSVCVGIRLPGLERVFRDKAFDQKFIVVKHAVDHAVLPGNPQLPVFVPEEHIVCRAAFRHRRSDLVVFRGGSSDFLLIRRMAEKADFRKGDLKVGTRTSPPQTDETADCRTFAGRERENQRAFFRSRLPVADDADRHRARRIEAAGNLQLGKVMRGRAETVHFHFIQGITVAEIKDKIRIVFVDPPDLVLNQIAVKECVLRLDSGTRRRKITDSRRTDLPVSGTRVPGEQAETCDFKKTPRFVQGGIRPDFQP